MKVENIKFKAKRLDNGEWILGSFGVMKIPALSKTTIGIVVEGGATLHEVDPSTVCQFTGLKDCKGREVWEGDILLNVGSDSQYTVMRSYCGGSFFIRKNGTVDDDMYLFELVREDEGIASFEVVGNKFDKENGV